MNHEFLLDKTDNVTDLRFAMTDHDWWYCETSNGL